LLLIGQGSLDELPAYRPAHGDAALSPNLVVQGAEPFAEDGWKRIRIGRWSFACSSPVCGASSPPSIRHRGAQR
jgi:uncharacterized protein YcbX